MFELSDKQPHAVADRSVRPAFVDDAAIITRIQVAAMIESLESGIDEPLSEEVRAGLDTEAMTQNWTSTITQPPKPGYRVLSALDGGTVVGFAATVPAPPIADHEWLSQPGTEIIALEAERQAIGEGHRSRLLAACTDLAISEGAQTVSIWLIAGDDEHIRFYQEAGLRPAGLHRKLAVGPHSISQHLWWAHLGE
ncbi:MAG: GNAT family N-acetyltransferase [Actinomycetaceae bacterium]|nr:GNAT family N-acetyltransferase [Actinomycetaceae bacterium]